MTAWLQSENAAPALGATDPFLIVGKALLERVIDQVDKAVRLTKNVTSESFLNDPLLRDAVSMPLIRIGTTLEAVLHVQPDLVGDDEAIGAAIDFGRDLLHFYRQIDTLRVYQAATVDAPKLRRKLAQALAAHNLV